MKGYAHVKVDPTDAKKIHDVLNGFGIKVMDPSKLHVTLMYDVNNPDIDPGVRKDTFYQATVTGVEHMGEPGSKWEAVALQLECPELRGRHLALRARGFKHSYKDLKLHMSIAYGAAVVKKLALVRELLKDGKLPSKIKLGQETWAPIKED